MCIRDSNEYIQWALRESLTKSRGKVIDLFRAWDADGSGQIDFDEFSTVLFALGFKCSRRDAQNVFGSFDVDGGGQIDYKELNKGLKSGVVANRIPDKSAVAKSPAAASRPGSAGNRTPATAAKVPEPPSAGRPPSAKGPAPRRQGATPGAKK